MLQMQTENVFFIAIITKSICYYQLSVTLFNITHLNLLALLTLPSLCCPLGCDVSTTTVEPFLACFTFNHEASIIWLSAAAVHRDSDLVQD